MSNTVNYDEMKTIVEDPKVLIIDVRSPQEVQSTGKIGNSINIPGEIYNLNLVIHNYRKLYKMGN